MRFSLLGVSFEGLVKIKGKVVANLDFKAMNKILVYLKNTLGWVKPINV